jgi:transcriptional regulator with XRE-family HTH domain
MSPPNRVMGSSSRRHWNQAELARGVNMAQPAVTRFEPEGTVPTLPVLERLARLLGAGPPG